MRIVVLTIMTLMLCVMSDAQVNRSRALVEKLSVLEKSTFECIYSHIEYDADLDKNESFDEILQLGRNYARYMPYGTYKSDSVVQLMDKNKRDALTFTQLNKIQVANGWGGTDCMLVDLKKQVLSHNVFGIGARYDESMPCFNWEFIHGETTILGYKCKMAKCSFRGREWTVWYSPDVKIPYGPWKLRGLPGLILRASDSTGAHCYEAIGLRTMPSEIYLPSRFAEVRILSRKECYRLTREMCFNFCKGMWEAYNADPVNNSRPAVAHLPYVPHELDCEE